MNLFLWFNNWLSLKCSIRCTFSAAHSGQKLVFVLRFAFSTFNHLILDSICSPFKYHIYFESFVPFLYCSCLKSLLWFHNWALKDMPLIDFVTFNVSISLIIRFGVRHWFYNGQFSLVQQLQPYSVVLHLNSLLLCD